MAGPRLQKGGDTRHSQPTPNSHTVGTEMRRFLETMATSPCQVVADFYDASLDPTRWPQALLSLGECMKADAVGLLLHDFDDGSGKYERAV